MGNNRADANCPAFDELRRFPMAKRGRKKRDRKYKKANHGKRPNA
jgi:hypothetical protein